jgi:hypothetical protein
MNFKEYVEGSIRVMFRDPEGYSDLIDSFDLTDPEANPEMFIANIKDALGHEDFQHYEYWVEAPDGRFEISDLTIDFIEARK